MLRYPDHADELKSFREEILSATTQARRTHTHTRRHARTRTHTRARTYPHTRTHTRTHMSAVQDAHVRVWDIKDLGLQATQRIMRASHPLRMMQEVRVRACVCVRACASLVPSASLMMQFRVCMFRVGGQRPTWRLHI